MKREDVVKAVADKFEKLGVPGHVHSLRKVPSSVECDVLLGGGRQVPLQGAVRDHEDGA